MWIIREYHHLVVCCRIQLVCEISENIIILLSTVWFNLYVKYQRIASSCCLLYDSTCMWIIREYHHLVVCCMIQLVCELSENIIILLSAVGFNLHVNYQRISSSCCLLYDSTCMWIIREYHLVVVCCRFQLVCELFGRYN